METNGVPPILVVDDEPLIRDLASTAISDAGFDAIEAASAAEAPDDGRFVQSPTGWTTCPTRWPRSPNVWPERQARRASISAHLG